MKKLNKILLIAVVVGFAIVAAAFLHSQNLTEYEGSIEENLSYELPAGYEPMKAGDSDPDDIYYVRESAGKRETIEIYYNGLDNQEVSYFSEDEIIPIDKRTEVRVSRFDWNHDSDNHLELLVVKDGYETYTLYYKCQETDKDNYYSSCSKAQQDEMLEFIRSFDFHRPDGKDMNIFQRLYRNYGVAGCALLGLTVLLFVVFPIAFGLAGAFGSGSKSGAGPDEDKVITSRDLHESMNRERAAKGETNIPSINNVQGASTSNLARRDHSWSSVPDFFIKLFRRK